MSDEPKIRLVNDQMPVPKNTNTNTKIKIIPK